MGGCSRNIEESAEDYQVIPYTYDDIAGRVLEGTELDKEVFTEEALESYSKMMSYVDHVAGKDSYYITKAYKVDIPEKYQSYVLKFVLKEYLDRYIKWEESKSVHNPFNIIVSNNEYYMASSYEPFHMNIAWHEQIKADFAEAYPEFHLNSFYVALDKTIPPQESQNYDYQNLSDWTHFYDERFYKDKKYYSNIINIFLPESTKEEDLDELVREMEPLLIKYCITALDFYILSSEDALNIIQSEEMETGNHYGFGEKNKSLYKYDKTYKIPLS